MKDNNDNKQNHNTRNILLGAGALGASKDMITGKKTMYHGTTKSNWDKIKNEGLMASKGGTGAALTHGSKEYVDISKNNVHMTRLKPVANMYATMNEIDTPIQTEGAKVVQKINNIYETYGKKTPNGYRASAKDMPGDVWNELGELMKKQNELGSKNQFKENMHSFWGKPKDGKVIKAKLDYDKYKKMTIDNAGSDNLSNIAKPFRPIAKNVAAKGPINVSPEEIIGSNSGIGSRIKHTAKALPGYIRNNPARFGAGLALAGTGAYLLGKGLNKEKEASDYKQEIEKIASFIDSHNYFV